MTEQVPPVAPFIIEMVKKPSWNIEHPDEVLLDVSELAPVAQNGSTPAPIIAKQADKPAKPQVQ